MVLVKATFQRTVRRFTISDDLSYDSLKKKLVDVFPEMKGVAPECVLTYYRDSDNDLVTISSDDELHTAQHHLVGDDGTLKLLITVKPQETKMEASQQQAVDSEEDDVMDDLVSGLLFGSSAPFSHHYHHHRPSSIFGRHNPFGSSFLFDLTPSWSDRRRMLQQQEERVRRQREYEDKLRKAHQEHIKEIMERMKKEQEKRRQEELERKKKETGEVAAKENESSDKPAIPNFPPGWVVNPYGSWEPVVYHHPSGGATHIWGPWGYTATYGDEEKKAAESTATTQQEENNQQEQQPIEEGEQQSQEQDEPIEA